MEVHVIKPQGYCYGVVRAMKMAKQIGDTTAGPVFGLGQMVHNRHMIEELAEHNVVTVDGPNRARILDQIGEGTVIFTAHGVSPAVVEKARARGLNTVDATCSDVVRTHELVDRLLADGYDVVYIGVRGHPEPEGVVGHDPARIHLVQEPADVDALDLGSAKVAITCQTTLSVWDTDDLIERVKARYPQAEVYNEICRATQERQEAAVAAASEVDLVIVVGSTRSSNSKRLVEVVEKKGGKPAYLVDSLEEIRPEWFRGAKRVGVTSGASTPSQLTRKVIEHLEGFTPPE
jgi:4-hydroxy-3-methylbut-2-enyl diphosphate reductase